MACGMICVHAVSKRFGDVAAVHDASLCAARGEFVALLGPSGCGKTTLLRLVAGFEHPDGGEIAIEDKPVAGGRTWVPPDRRRVGMVFQDYALFPHLTVAENVGYGVERRARGRRLGELLDLVGLGGYESRYPHELSGGQQQRVALARALAPEPAVVLLDEPWSNIDPLRRGAMRDDLAAILRRVGVTVVLVTHDREEAFSLADRIALMKDGSVVQEGTPEELYLAPATRWAAEFVGAANFVPGERRHENLVETLLGAFPTANPACAATVQVLIRPELLELVPDPDGAGTVVSREFRGHDVFYRVDVGGRTLVSHRPSTESVPLGARVRVQPHQARVPVFV